MRWLKISNNIKEIKKKNSSFKSPTKRFFQKLTTGIIIPIILLSFAGLFLGLGNEIIEILNTVWNTTALQAEHNGAYITPKVMQNIGEIIFANLGLLFAIAIAITFTSDAGIAGFSAFVGWIIFNAFQVPFITELTSLDGFDIFFYQNVPSGLITTNMGLMSLETSLFGGVVVGFIVALIYVKFHTFELPTVLCFFSGTRLVPIVTFLLMPILAICFLLIYPLLGIGLNQLAILIADLSQGVSLFLFGTIEKILMPFGLDDSFASSLFSFSSSSNNDLFYLISPLITKTSKITTENYLQGNYPVAMFALPAAGIAMILATKGANLKMIFSTIFLAMTVSFLTGITEPLEFFILFWTPFLYFGFHIWMSGISLLFLNFFNGNLEICLYGGLIDFILYGAIPAINGKGVIVWPIIIFGIIYFIFYFAVFYFNIFKLKLQLVDEKTNTLYQHKKDSFDAKKLRARGIDPQTGIELKRSKKIQGIVKNLGGFKNIETIDSCFTRLRLTIVDKKRINQNNLKHFGAVKITTLGDHSIQIIFGKEADRIKVDLLTYNKYLDELAKFKKEQRKNNQ